MQKSILGSATANWKWKEEGTNVMRYALTVFALVTMSFGQTFEVKDKHGNPTVTISDVKMTRYSGMTEFYCVVKNISGYDLGSVRLQVKAHKKHGPELEFEVNVCDVHQWAEAASQNSVAGCDYQHSLLHKNSIQTARQFLDPDDFTSELEFSFPTGWQSPEDLRLETAAQAKKDMEEERTAAIQARKDEQHERAEAALIRRRCSAVYRSTIDKKISDLTVRQQRQVTACQGLDLYPPQ